MDPLSPYINDENDEQPTSSNFGEDVAESMARGLLEHEAVIAVLNTGRMADVVQE